MRVLFDALEREGVDPVDFLHSQLGKARRVRDRMHYGIQWRGDEPVFIAPADHGEEYWASCVYLNYRLRPCERITENGMVCWACDGTGRQNPLGGDEGEGSRITVTGELVDGERWEWRARMEDVGGMQIEGGTLEHYWEDVPPDSVGDA